MSTRDYLHFWFAWLRGPHRIGAVVPSGRSLSRAMAAAVPRTDGLIVELGAGTGTITRQLLSRFSATQLIAVERDSRLAGLLRGRWPSLRVLNTDACDLDCALERGEHREVDAVVSALPLLSLPREDRAPIVSQISSLLGRDGRLIQFTYSRCEPIPAELAEAHGIRGRRLRYVVRNLPPASIWCYGRGVNGWSPARGAGTIERLHHSG
ncbi:MAG: methyltransferase domain-containing protein [Polyangia bacterium]